MNEDIFSPVSLAKGIHRRLLCWCGVPGATAFGWAFGGLTGAEAPTTAGPLFHEATHQFKAMTTTLYQHRLPLEPEVEDQHRADRRRPAHLLTDSRKELPASIDSVDWARIEIIRSLGTFGISSQ